MDCLEDVEKLLRKGEATALPHEAELIKYYCGLHIDPWTIAWTIQGERRVAAFLLKVKAAGIGSDVSKDDLKTALNKVRNGGSQTATISQLKEIQRNAHEKKSSVKPPSDR